MGLLSGIGKAIGGIADAVGGVAKGVTGILDQLGIGGIMNGPLGGLIASVFPPAGAVIGGANLLGMIGSIADQVGGGDTY